MCVTHCRRTRTPITTLSTPSPVAHTELEHLLHLQTEGGHVHKQIRIRAEHASRATTGHPVLLRTAQLQHVPETMATLRCSLPRLSAGRGSRRWCARRPDTVDHLHIESKGSGRNVSDVNPQRWQQRERRNVAAGAAQLDQVPPPWLAPQLPYVLSSTRARAVEGLAPQVRLQGGKKGSVAAPPRGTPTSHCLLQHSHIAAPPASYPAVAMRAGGAPATPGSRSYTTTPA